MRATYKTALMLCLWALVSGTVSAQSDRLDTRAIEQKCVHGAHTLEIAYCIGEQVEKADKLVDLIFNSYVRRMKKRIEEEAEVPSIASLAMPISALEALKESRRTFDAYRKQIAEIGYFSYYPGTASKTEAPYFAYRVTMEYAQHLLEACNKTYRLDKAETLDLTRSDWCHEALP